MTKSVDRFIVEAVNGGDLGQIRITLSSLMIASPGAEQEIRAAVAYIEASVTKLWDEHDGREFAPEEQWNNDYLGLLHSQFKFNFSRERFEKMLAVGKKLHAKNTYTAPRVSSAPAEPRATRETERREPLRKPEASPRVHTRPSVSVRPSARGAAGWSSSGKKSLGRSTGWERWLGVLLIVAAIILVVAKCASDN
ncbi:hypothetical protein ABE504_16420 [Paenibacillus oryzisoli]|uniref:hypothetical protein n=1 Tax=Paenibacillus oryzisoli TaxID=1850517 RepID=UPI003D2DED6D